MALFDTLFFSIFSIRFPSNLLPNIPFSFCYKFFFYNFLFDTLFFSIFSIRFPSKFPSRFATKNFFILQFPVWHSFLLDLLDSISFHILLPNILFSFCYKKNFFTFAVSRLRHSSSSRSSRFDFLPHLASKYSLLILFQKKKKKTKCAVIRFSGVPAGEACTIVLRGATSQLLDEAERSLHDALAVISQTVNNTKTVFGGGCSEMIMAQAIEEVAKKVSRFVFVLFCSAFSILLLFLDGMRMLFRFWLFFCFVLFLFCYYFWDGMRMLFRFWLFFCFFCFSFSCDYLFLFRFCFRK